MRYREGDLNALRANAICCRLRMLDGKQLCRVYKTITTKGPLQYGFEFALWPRGMVRDLMGERFGGRLSGVSVGRLLKKLWLICACEQNPERVWRWRAEDFQKLQVLAKKACATLYFCDEAGVRSDFHSGATCVPKVQTPIVEAIGQRDGTNIISAIRPRGDNRFMMVDGCMYADKFIEFLKHLLHNAERPIFLMVDGHPSYRHARSLSLSARQKVDFDGFSCRRVRLI